MPVSSSSNGPSHFVKVTAILGIVAAFVAMRFVVYWLFPLSESFSWFSRDFLMTLPRLVCGGAAWLIGRRWWTSAELGFHGNGLRLAMAFAALDSAASLLGGGLWKPGWTYAVLFGVITIPVVFWEELAFRGFLYNALAEWRGVSVAISGSAIVFVLMHVQAQPLTAWPWIGIFGLAAGALRARGVSLPFLMAVHWLGGVPFFNAWDTSFSPRSWLQFLVLFAAVPLFWPRSQERRADADLLDERLEDVVERTVAAARLRK